MKLPSKIEAVSVFPILTLPSIWNVDLENVVSTGDHENKGNSVKTAEQQTGRVWVPDLGNHQGLQVPGSGLGWGLTTEEKELSDVKKVF